MVDTVVGVNKHDVGELHLGAGGVKLVGDGEGQAQHLAFVAGIEMVVHRHVHQRVNVLFHVMLNRVGGVVLATVHRLDSGELHAAGQYQLTLHGMVAVLIVVEGNINGAGHIGIHSGGLNGECVAGLDKQPLNLVLDIHQRHVIAVAENHIDDCRHVRDTDLAILVNVTGQQVHGRCGIQDVVDEGGHVGNVHKAVIVHITQEEVGSKEEVHPLVSFFVHGRCFVVGGDQGD